MWTLMTLAALASPPPEPPPALCAGADRQVGRTLARNARDDQRERRKGQYEGMEERDAARLAYVEE